MKASKTQKHLKEIPYPPEKAFKKKKEYYTSKDKCPSFTNFFRMPKINIQIYRMRNKKNLKNNLQLKQKASAWTASRGNIKSIFTS